MKILALSIVAALTLGMASAGPTNGQRGARDPLLQTVPAFEFRMEDGPLALRRIATAAGLRIEIESGVQGKVTLTLPGGAAENAFRDLTERLDSEFSVDGGMVRVFRKGSYGISDAIEEFLWDADPSHVGPLARLGTDLSLSDALARVLGDRIPFRIAPGTESKIGLEIERGPNPNAFLRLLRQTGLRFRVQAGTLTVYRPPVPTQRTFEYRNAHVRCVLRLLFLDEGLPYSIGPEVQGEVTVSVANLPFEEALRKVLRQVDATCRIEDGRWHIFWRGASHESAGLPSRARGSR